MDVQQQNLPNYQLLLHQHIDRYSSNDNFVCFLCSFESHDPVECLNHLGQTHKIIFTDIRHIPLLPQYLEFWRTHPPPIIDSDIPYYQTIDSTSEEDFNIRNLLHQMRLNFIMVEHEKEREEKSEMKCLFCNENFRGTWHEYLQWEFEEHQFNPGRPSNLIFIPELIALLRKQLDSNICICCGAQFPNQRTLRSHLRKKRHLRIPNDPSFDRYYMVNYLELNGRAPIDDEDDDLNAEMQPLEIAAADFNEIEVNETYCLICDNVFRNPEDAVRHMRQAHHFDLNDVRKLLKWDFYNCVRFVNFARYSKSRNHCFVCNGEVDSDYVKHIESHKDKCPMDLKKFVGEDQLLIPFIDGDPLLTVLEDNVE